MKQQIPFPAGRPSRPPVVCTLDDEQLVKQGLEWSDLRALSLSAERIDGGVETTYPVELFDQVQDLADRENSCCGTWLATKVSRVGDVVLLELTTANPDGLAVIHRMAGLDS